MIERRFIYLGLQTLQGVKPLSKASDRLIGII
ncbi:uncharacterized protein METZ01_LOCUS445748, partial [marine metagenome]